MASNARVFFAGVGTTFVILAVGFGGGLMLAKTSLEPSRPSRSVVDNLPPARVVLAASAEAATPSQAFAQSVAAPESPQFLLASGETQRAAENEARQAAERQKQTAERIERRKAEERARRKKNAEHKARREAARLALQQQEEQPGRSQAAIVALGREDGQARWSGPVFGH
jgi:hypothetical protein